jgi:hypothetical protein
VVQYGAAYRSRLAELDWYQDGEYVITDEAGKDPGLWASRIVRL